MEFRKLAKEYRVSAERLREREQQLTRQPPQAEREDRLRMRERILILQAEYWQLIEVAGCLERHEREGSAR